MSKLRKMTTAYLARFTKAFGFQRIQKEIVHCGNTLLAGSTMGARVRRKEFLALIKEVHSIVKDQAKRHGDEAAFEARDKKLEESQALTLEVLEGKVAKEKAEFEAAEKALLEAKNEPNSTSGDESPDKGAENEA